MAIAVLAAMPPAALAGETPDPPGRQLAERLCSRCHAIGPDGESPHPPAPPFRTFAARWPVEDIAEALAEGIVVGHPDMPMFELTPAEIDDLIEYLETLAP
jgi:mono/diheme cytochrome c family protein